MTIRTIMSCMHIMIRICTYSLRRMHACMHACVLRYYWFLHQSRATYTHIQYMAIYILMDQSITDLHYLATAADDDVAAGLEQSSTVRTGTRQQQ